MNDDRYELIELMALHEEALADYYQAAENKFQNKEIWSFLAGEERKHAMWIRSIRDNIVDGSVIFNDDLSADLYTVSITKLKSEKNSVEKNLRKLSQVFDFTINIENDIIEMQFLEVFSSPLTGIQNTLNSLKSDTINHRLKLKKAYQHFLKQKEKIEEERKKKTAAVDDDFIGLKDFNEASQEEKEAINELRTENEIALNKQLDEIFEANHYIGLHAEHERLLSNLYGLFCRIFPNDEIWPFMAEEERKHEYWLKQIIMKMKDGTILFKKPNYSVDKVRAGIINLAEIIQFCKEYQLSHKEAYQIAFDQESSMLEDKFFDNFSSDAPAIEEVFKKLIEDTVEHKEWLSKKRRSYT